MLTTKVNITNFLILLVATAGILVMSAKPVMAIDDNQYTQSIENCGDLESRLRAKTDEFTQKRQEHLDKYSQISGMFSSINKTLSGAGYDTDLLVELQPGLDRRIVEFSNVSQSFLSEMTDTTESACRDVASFKQELGEARESLKAVQSSVADIHDYVHDIVIESIQTTINGAGQ